MLAPNPDFFRDDLRATAMQSITVTQLPARADQPWEAYMEAVRHDIDWQALITLLE
jgi:hypothetical protein